MVTVVGVCIVSSPTSLVAQLLRDALLRVWGQSSLHTVGHASDGLLDLLASCLLMVRGNLFGDLGGEILAV